MAVNHCFIMYWKALSSQQIIQKCGSIIMYRSEVNKPLGQNLCEWSKFKKKKDCLLIVWVYPDYDDGKEADWYEEHVEAKQQPVYDETHLHPLFWALATTHLLLHVEADGLEVPAQAPQLPDGCWLHWLWRSLSSFKLCHHSADILFCNFKTQVERWGCKHELWSASYVMNVNFIPESFGAFGFRGRQTR